MYKYLVCFALLATAYAGVINIKDCGHGEVKEVRVAGCEGDNCVIHKGKSLDVEIDVVSNQDTEAVEFHVLAKIGPLEIEVPGLDTDGCHYVKCPLKKGEAYTFKFNQVIPAIAPIMKTTITVKSSGDNGDFACGKFNGEIQD